MSLDWFEDAFGFTEKGNSHIQGKFELRGDKLFSKTNNREFAIGKFTTPTLEELRKEGKRLLLQQNKKQKSPVVLAHVTTEDILQEHGKPVNKHALFQVASQFNCLEFVSPSRTPEHGITCYDLDNTQGPACAIAAGAATLYRNYFVPVHSHSAYSDCKQQVGQSRELQLDTLDVLARELNNREEKYWVMKNGYINSSCVRLARLAPLLDPYQADIDRLRQLVKIGVHEDVQVTARMDAEQGGGDDAERKTPQIVSQVFCSAVGVSYTLVGEKDWHPFAILVLEAAYEATLWQAVINFFKNKSVTTPTFLTFLGGGAFGNPSSWIAYAIARAVALLESEDAGSVLDCRVAHFREIDRKMVEMIDEQLAEQRQKYL